MRHLKASGFVSSPCCRCWRASSHAAKPSTARRCRQLRRAGGQDHRRRHRDRKRRISCPMAARWAPPRSTMPFCRVIGVATPTADSHIGFEVWLPPAASGTANSSGEGSGGSAGAISAGAMREALRPAMPPCPPTMAISPTPSSPMAAANRPGRSGHPEKMMDFALRALHLSTVAAKQVVKAFYGQPACEDLFRRPARQAAIMP